MMTPAMRLWLARKSEVPLRDQLVSQIVLGITSRELAAGQRLPSTRELARRLRVHTNTVSAAYRELARRGWVEFRRGSGVYVRARKQAAEGLKTLPYKLDHLIAGLFRSAREQGFPLAEVRARIGHWLELQPPDHFLVIEPDPELRAILIAELRAAAALPVNGAGLEVCRSPQTLAAAVPVFLNNQAERIRAALPPDAECIELDLRSVTGSLAGWTPIPRDALIAVASRWPDFLKWARTMLLAAGAEADALDLRDARRARWQDGLRQATVVVADVLTAQRLPRGCRAIPFRLIADASLARLREFHAFLTRPLA